MNARSTSYFLYLIGKLKPEAWDAIHPHGPRVSVASREYLIAMAVKGFAAELGNRAVARRLSAVQKTLVNFAAEHIATSYDDDDWCGTGRPRIPLPGPRPFGFSFEDVMLNPQPLPPRELQREIGGYLLMLSEATSQRGAAKDLDTIGKSLVR